MKKLIISILSVLMLICATGCSSSNTSENDENDLIETTINEEEKESEENIDIETTNTSVDNDKKYTTEKRIFGYYGMSWRIGNQSVFFFCDENGNIAEIYTWQCYENSISDDLIQKFDNDDSYGVGNIRISGKTFFNPQIILSLSDDKRAEVDELIRTLYSHSEDPEMPIIEMINRANDKESVYEYIESISDDADKIANLGIEAETIDLYDLPIGGIYISVDNLNVRTAPSTTAEAIGTVNRSTVFGASPGLAYDIVEAEGYTWYRIGKDEWIASKDDWVTFNPYD